MKRDAGVVFGVALAARLAVVVWAAGKIAPTADGAYYDIVARRIATGQGYTWLWPDGAVTYAAHYPVGYPALVALVYAIFGASPTFAMIMNAIFGALAAVATHDLLSTATRPRLALLGGLGVALHPALVPYTAALMTEGTTAAVLILAAAFANRAREAGTPRIRAITIALCGFAMGLATLLRPQCLALAPILGFLASGTSWRSRIVAAVAVGALALAVCAPWTVRNCVRMDRCAIVSVNGGWNLAIGAQTTDGGWHEVQVPEACKEVFQEAAKDTCFGHEAMRAITAAPIAWLARAPGKIRMTFDYFGAAPWYLHAAAPGAFDDRAKFRLGVLETAASRLLLIAALASVFMIDGPRRRLRAVVCTIGILASVTAVGAIGYLAIAVAIALLGVRALLRGPVIVPITGAVILATAATHAVFFGSGRYGLVVVPFVTALAFVRTKRPSPIDDPAAMA